MDNQQKISPKLLERQIQILTGKLMGSLPGSGWTAAAVQRRAFRRVYVEDVEQESLKPVIDLVLKTAMDLCRAKRKLAEPDYPQSARERYEKGKNEPLPDFLRGTPKVLTPEQQESIDALKYEMTEMVDAILHEDCGDTALELSDEERTVIATEGCQYIDELLRKKVDDLESEDSRNRISEEAAEHMRDLIQRRIDGWSEGA